MLLCFHCCSLCIFFGCSIPDTIEDTRLAESTFLHLVAELLQSGNQVDTAKLQPIRRRLILFENVVVTVRSYSCHLQGLETLTLRYHHALSATLYGELLLRASLFTLAKGALFLGPLHSLCQEDIVHRELDILADRICSRQEILFFMVVDAIRISSSLLLARSTLYPSDKLQRVLQRMSVSGYGGALLSGSSESGVYEKLATLRRRIDILFAQSTPLCNAFVRGTSHPTFHEIEFRYTDDTIPPITFASHEEAMACAMYALVQVYCDRQLLQSSLDAASGLSIGR
jgi:hypothetical protein